MNEKLFELADSDKAKHVEGRLRAIVEDAAKKVAKAEDRLEAAIEYRDATASTLAEFLLLMAPSVPAAPSNTEVAVAAVDKLIERNEEQPDGPKHATFMPKEHVLVTDLNNQYGISLIPAMCRQSEVLFVTHDGAVKTAITRAYADEAGFRLRDSGHAAGSTNEGVQDSLGRVQCLTEEYCDSNLSGYCTAPFTCQDHMAAAQKAAQEENAKAKSSAAEIIQERVDAIVARGGHVQGGKARLIKAHAAGGDFTKVVRDEWGTGGFADFQDDGTHPISVDFSPKGLRLKTVDEPHVERKLTWTEVANITGRLINEGVIAEDDNLCPACQGDGRIPDKSGGGHHGTCPECKGTGKWMQDVAEAAPSSKDGYLFPVEIANLVSQAESGLSAHTHGEPRFDLAITNGEARMTVAGDTDGALLDATVMAIEDEADCAFGAPQRVGELMVYVGACDR